MNRLLALLPLAVIIPSILCSPSGFLSMLHWPGSMYVPETSPGIVPNDASAILGSFLGLTAKKIGGWEGKSDVLNRPQALVVMELTYENEGSVEGLREMGRTFDLVEESDNLGSDALQRAVHSVIADVETRFPEATVVRIKEDAIVSLNADSLEDVHIGANWQSANGVSENVAKILASVEKLRLWLVESGARAVNGFPDVYAISVPGPVNSVDSDALRREFEKLSKTVDAVYNGNYVGAILAEKYEISVKKRAKRQADDNADKPAADNAEPKALTKDDFRSHNFSAMFGIILLISITIGLLVFFVATGMWFMEPGKDTIIYRMSMTRIKRE